MHGRSAPLPKPQWTRPLACLLMKSSLWSDGSLGLLAHRHYQGHRLVCRLQLEHRPHAAPGAPPTFRLLAVLAVLHAAVGMVAAALAVARRRRRAARVEDAVGPRARPMPVEAAAAAAAAAVVVVG